MMMNDDDDDDDDDCSFLLSLCSVVVRNRLLLCKTSPMRSSAISFATANLFKSRN
jgi:hypothetical protein